MRRFETDRRSRPDRKSPHGIIPSDLPSVYDTVDGSHGSINLILAPLIEHFARNGEEWDSLQNEQAGATDVLEPIQTFFDAYADGQADNDDWREVYETISLQCAKGWIREALSLGEVSEATYFTIIDYTKALTKHLKAAEERWGVEWLTSNRPFEGQNDRMLDPMRKYWDGYRSGEITGKDFFLNLAGDALINLIRLKVSPESLYSWTESADSFVTQKE